MLVHMLVLVPYGLSLFMLMLLLVSPARECWVGGIGRQAFTITNGKRLEQTFLYRLGQTGCVS